MGANVLRLEPPSGGQTQRTPPMLGSADHDVSGVYDFLNAGKTIVIQDNTLEALKRLLETEVAAVIAEERDPVIELARERCVPLVEFAGWPAPMRLEDASLSGFTALAVGGMLSMIGSPEREPLRLGGHQAAYATGLAGFSALSAILAARDTGIMPESARVSLVETMLWVNWKAVCGARFGSGAPSREGARAEFQTLPCLDGHVAVVYTTSRFNDVVRLIGDERLKDPKFATRSWRQKHVAELYAVIAPWFAERTREQIYTAAQAANVPFGPVYEPRELLNDEQYLARAFTCELSHESGLSLQVPRLPLLWNGLSFAPSARKIRPLEDVLDESHQRRDCMPKGRTLPLSGLRVIDFGQLTAGANRPRCLPILVRT